MLNITYIDKNRITQINKKPNLHYHLFIPYEINKNQKTFFNIFILHKYLQQFKY